MRSVTTMLMSTSLCNQGSNLLRLARHRQINARIHELGFLWSLGFAKSERGNIRTSGEEESFESSGQRVRSPFFKKVIRCFMAVSKSTAVCRRSTANTKISSEGASRGTDWDRRGECSIGGKS